MIRYGVTKEKCCVSCKAVTSGLLKTSTLLETWRAPREGQRHEQGTGVKCRTPIDNECQDRAVSFWRVIKRAPLSTVWSTLPLYTLCMMIHMEDGRSERKRRDCESTEKQIVASRGGVAAAQPSAPHWRARQAISFNWHFCN